jgi:hypothetical protein
MILGVLTTVLNCSSCGALDDDVILNDEVEKMCGLF